MTKESIGYKFIDSSSTGAAAVYDIQGKTKYVGFSNCVLNSYCC